MVSCGKNCLVRIVVMGCDMMCCDVLWGSVLYCDVVQCSEG